MWCGLLLLLLLPASRAETTSEFDRCVLGDCGPLAAAAGATVPPVDGVTDRYRDGASVTALKRSAEDRPVEAAEGSGVAESDSSAETGTAGADPVEEAGPRIESAATAGESASGRGDGGSSAGDAGKEATSPPATSTERAPGAGGGPTEPPGDERGGREPAGSGQDLTAGRTADHCSCDLTVSECDVDCCCDPDCGAEDRLAFSVCQRRDSATTDRRYCVQSELIFSNNTEHRLERVEGGLLCIVRDNLISRSSFPPVEPASDSVAFDRLAARSVRRRRYLWEVPPSSPPPPPPAADRYRSGDLMWTVSDGVVQRWAVRWRGPVSRGLCDAERPVRFLREAHTDCWLTADPADLRPLNGSSVYRTVCLLTAPPSDSRQELSDVQCGPRGGGGGGKEPAVPETSTDRPPAQAVSVTPYLCDDDHRNCTQVSAVPSVRVVSGRLQDALLSVLFVVEQRAGRLAAVRAQLVLGAAPLGSAVRQRRRVEFRRPGASGAPVRRSGAPGYQRGRPLLAAAMVTNSSREGRPADRVPSGAGRPLLLPSPGRGGGCSADSARWRELTFGVDAVVSCRLEAVSADCSLLQRRLMTTLTAGLPAPPADTAVAALGSAVADGQWVPLLHAPPELSPQTTANGCRGLVAAARWHVLVARTGAAWRPQARVVGVRLSFGRPVSVSAAAGGRLSVTVQSSVTFQEVTRRPVPGFAQPPRVDISLPADFFYPFSAGGAAPSRGGPAWSVLAVLLSAGHTVWLAG